MNPRSSSLNVPRLGRRVVRGQGKRGAEERGWEHDGTDGTTHLKVSGVGRHVNPCRCRGARASRGMGLGGQRRKI